MQHSAQNVNPFTGYKFVSLPNLSAVRLTSDTYGNTTAQVHSKCTERDLLVALAFCIGSYCSANDLLLGWQSDSDRHSVGNRSPSFRAARIRWGNATTWDAVLQTISLKETTDEPDAVYHTLELEIEADESPFVAVVAENLDYQHPLVATLNSKANTVYIKYSMRHFHQSSAEILSKQLSATITQIIDHPDHSLRSIDFFPRSLLSIVDQCKDDAPYTHIPQARIVTDFVLRFQVSHPSLIAVEFHPDLSDRDQATCQVQTLTYSDLHLRSNQFAAFLIAKGLEREERVALCIPRGIEFHICLLGILKSGACYVPIDPELPDERRKFIARDSGARFVITTDNIAEFIRESDDYPKDDVSAAHSDGLAYLLYTSGTTGVPKGCLLTHDGLAQAILALSWFSNQAGSLRNQSPQQVRYLAVASTAFDVHLAETFVPLALGMTLVTAPRSQLLEDLPRWLRELHISHVGIVPSLIEATMLAVEESGGPVDDGDDAIHLSFIASGGEKMSDSILQRWADHPSVSLANFYGPSEVTIGCAARFMSSNTRKESIGCVFKNCSAYVVDESLNILPRGGVGELLVGGRLVGRGYHNRDDLTRKAFLDWENGKAYRTGDLVRLMPDDTFEILGRIDTQIKLRGVRIESEGVSAVIRKAAVEFPSLQSKSVPDVCTILARHPSIKSDQLVSFIAWDPNVSITTRRSVKPKIITSVPQGLIKALKSASTKELASYMRPAHIIPLDFLPLNTNGKTDSKILLSVFQSEDLAILGMVDSDGLGDAHSAEQSKRTLNSAEMKLAELVSHYTSVSREQLTPYSNLFALGLDSLALVRLASEMRSEFGPFSAPLAIGQLIQNPTIEALSIIVEKISIDSENLPTNCKVSFTSAFEQQWRDVVGASIEASQIQAVLPTFPVQDGVLYRSSSHSNLYVQHVILRLYDNVCIKKLKDAWSDVVARHDILRTVFYFGKEIIQVILLPEDRELPWTETALSITDTDSFSDSFMRRDSVRFACDINENIASQPPFRIALYVGDNASFLTLSIHHAIYDGVSLPLLLQEVEQIYLGETLQDTLPISKVLDIIYDVDTARAEEVWKEVFESFDWSKIPGRLSSGETACTLSHSFKQRLDYWEAKSASSKVSLHSLLVASFGVSLGKHLYNTSDIVFGVIRSGRSFVEEDMNNSQCPLISVLPLRVTVSKSIDTLQVVQKNIGKTIAYEHIPLNRLQRWLRPGKPLFEILFSVQFISNISSRTWDTVLSTQPQADYILAVEVVINKDTGELKVDTAYTDPISREFLSQFFSEFEKIAMLLADSPERNLEEFYTTSSELQLFHDGDFESFLDGDELEIESVDQDVESRISAVVSKFLGIDEERIQPMSSLVTYGLDSIKSVGLSRALKKEGWNITALGIMQHPTIRHIAFQQSQPTDGTTYNDIQAESFLRNERSEIAKLIGNDFVRLSDSDCIEVFPTTILQAGMLSQTVNSAGSLYVHAFPYALSPSLDLGRLKQAWQSAVEIFNILRTSFHFLPETGTWVQAVHSAHYMDWLEIPKLANTSLNVFVESVIKSIGFDSVSAFAKPPVYWRLIRTDDDASLTLILIIHHALYDGISMSKLSEAIDALYRQEPLSPTPHFVDLLGYFVYQEHHGTEYWLKYLSGFNKPTLPHKFSCGDVEDPVASFDIQIPSDRLKKACSHFQVTLQAFGQAALARVLAGLYNRRDIVFGHVISGRNIPKSEDVIGPMINTIPCRITLTPEMQNIQLIRSIHRRNQKSLEWQHASLRSIQRQLGKGTIWDVIFIFQPSLDSDINNGQSLWQFDDSEDEIAKLQYPINIELHQHVDRVVIKAACQATILNIEELKVLLKQFAETFKNMIDHPYSNTLDGLPLLNGNSETELSRSATPDSQLTDMVVFDQLDPRVSLFFRILAESTKVPLSAIKPNASLLSLGIDSITAIQISSKARKAGIPIHAVDILRSERAKDVFDTFAANEEHKIAQAYVHTSSSFTAPGTRDTILHQIKVDKGAIEDIYPASPGMRWLIGMWQLSRHLQFQHAFAFGLPSDIDEAKLKSALSALVNHHAILRSAFAFVDEKDVRIITFKELPEERLWSVRTINGGKPTDEILEKFMKDLVSSPLSTSIPPFQAIFLRCNGSVFFVIHLHHFQYDAWSMDLLIRDLERFYHGEKPINSSRLSHFLTSVDSARKSTEQMRYWQAYLAAPFQPSLLPKLVSSQRGGRQVITNYRALQDVVYLREQARAKSLSLNAVFLGCWARVQAEASAAGQATFGLWQLGRSWDIDDVDILAVPCMNVLPIHVTDTTLSLEVLCDVLQSTLRQRSPIVEQSYLDDISQWVGYERTMCNVFVNIIIGSSRSDGLLKPINMPYYIPNLPGVSEAIPITKLGICKLLQDSVMIDFVITDESIITSIEFSEEFLDNIKATELVEKWARLVNQVLRS